MQLRSAWWTVPGNERLIVAGAVVVALAAVAVLVARRLRVGPQERERRRRFAVNAQGRVSDAVVTDIENNVLHYTYSVGGVTYSAAQDISALLDLLPGEPARLIGPAWLKYSTNNPANSIVVCEQWSGLRGPQPIAKTWEGSLNQ